MSEDAFADAWEESLPLLLNDPTVDEILHPAAVGSRRYHGGAVYHHSVKGGCNFGEGDIPQTLSVKRHREERAGEARAMIKQRYGGVAWRAQPAHFKSKGRRKLMVLVS